MQLLRKRGAPVANPIITTDDKGYWWIHWPESVDGYREGPYSEKANVLVRIKEEGYPRA